MKVEVAVVDFSPDQDNGLLLPAVQTGGVSVASGDVNGDNSALGDPVTFTYTVRNTSSAYEGTHVLYQDVVVPPGEGSVPKGDWIADVTYDSVDVLGQPTVAMEALTTAHEGFLI